MVRDGCESFLGLPKSIVRDPIFRGDPALLYVYLTLATDAAHKPTTVFFNATHFDLGTGEAVSSFRVMADKTLLSPKVVRRCLEVLEARGWVRAHRGHAECEKRARERAHRGTVFTICDYEQLYGSRKKKGTPKGKPCSEKTPKKGTLTPSVPLYSEQENTLLHVREREHFAAQDGQPAGGPQVAADFSAQKESITPDCLVAAWKQAASRFGLSDISEVPPARLRAIEAAIRAKNDLSFWQAAFEAAGKEKAWSNGKRPDFDYCLTYMKALRLIEGASKPKPVHHQREITAKDLTR